MNAKEARAYALNITHGSQQKQYEEVKKLIVTAAEKGEFTCHYYNKSLIVAVDTQLREEGYEISSYDGGQRDGITVTISW